MKKWMTKLGKGFRAPFIGCWRELRDWKTALIFLIVFLVLSSEIWVSYIIGGLAFGAGNNALGTTLVSFASACGLFGIGPATPFFPLCIGITAGIKALLNKFKNKYRR